MGDYLKQKALGRDLVQDRLDKEDRFQRDLKRLQQAPVEKVDDFQKTLVKDLKPDRISTVGEALPVKNAFVAQAEIEAKRQAAKELAGKGAEEVLDYGQLRKEFTQKMKQSRAADALKKKALGIVPFLGAGYAALDGDPAMAAEELAGDIPVAGQVYEAIKPSDSGNVEEERQMIAERNAREDYDNSPARMARLKALQGMIK
jgi:hypothetical protein